MSSASPPPLPEANPSSDGPLLLHVDAAGDAPGWTRAHQTAIRSVLAERGAVQIRGLGLRDAAAVGAVAQQMAVELMDDKEAFAARESLRGGVYSSSAWPAKQQMCMHHEMSYRLEFPGLMSFGCLAAPGDGGTIGIADSAMVLESLPADVVERFASEGWILTRCYTDEIGLSIGEAFGTENRDAIESYCESNAIDVEWHPGGELRTRQHRGAVVHHPRTGRPCWFNQIAFLSEWTMKQEVHEFLVDMYGPDGLPFNTRFGNGDPIGQDVIAMINDAYDANTSHVQLQLGDLLIVDNIGCAHSREPYEGHREVVVALADPVRLADLSPTLTTVAI